MFIMRTERLSIYHFYLLDSDWYLLIIKEAKVIGYLPPLGGAVYCIERVLLIPLSVEKSIDEIKIEVSVVILHYEWFICSLDIRSRS